MRAELPGDVTVRTGTETAEAAAAVVTGGAGALTAALLVFATVAVLVAGLVIANTFAVLLAQRTRELGLLRCVGATSRQVRRSVLGSSMPGSSGLLGAWQAGSGVCRLSSSSCSSDTCCCNVCRSTLESRGSRSVRRRSPST